MANRAGAPPGTTFLTGSQAAQILEKLKVIKNIEGQTIKIQTIQTNPQTGAKHIVAIPIVQASSAGGPGPANLSISPMKSIRTYNSCEMGGATLGGRTIKIGSPRAAGSGYTSGHVSLVKPSSSSGLQLVATSSGGGGHGIQTVHVTTSVVGPTATSTSSPHHIHSYTASSSGGGHAGSLHLTPQKRTSSSAAALQTIKYEAVKRQHESDLLDASDAKRRKTDKGG